MKKAGLFLLVLAVTAGMAAAGDISKQLKVRSLLHTAQDLYQTPGARARAGRLVALGEYIHSLKTDDLVAMRFLYELDAFRGDKKNAQAEAQAIFDAQSNNFFAAMRWLDTQIEARQTSSERISFLQTIVQSSKYSAALRSQAGVKLYEVYKGIGDEKKARETIDHAIKLDPMNAQALSLRLLGNSDADAELKAGTYLGLIRANPRNTQTIWMMGKLLNEIGLSKEAVEFYTAAWAVESNGKEVSQMPGELAVDYLNAMLSAGQAEMAWKLFSPQRQRLAEQPLFQGLMIEAAKAAHQDQDTQVAMISALRKYYFGCLAEANIADGLKLSAPTPNKDAPNTAKARTDLAAFYLIEQDSPKQAISEITDARKSGAKGQIVDLIENAAKLKNNDTKALAEIIKLSKNYAMAGAFLADYYLRTGDKTKAAEVVTKSLAMGRGSRASRYLMTLAGKLGLNIDPIKKSSQVAQIVKGFDRQYFNLGLEPQNYLALSIKRKVKGLLQESGQPQVGQAIYVEVTLKNIGQLDIALGEGGMVKRDIMLSAQLDSPQGDSPFMANPVAFLSAGKYLKPGQSVTGWTRLDAGHIDWYLTANPLGDAVLQVSAYINPEKKGEKLFSAIPQIKPATAKITRKGLLKEINAAAYKQALGNIGANLSGRPKLQISFMAARQIGALVTYARMVELKEIQPPAELKGVVKISGAIDLLNKALACKEGLVRAEVIASMQYVTMGPDIMNAFGAVIEDPDAYVRFRLVELLGNVGGQGNMAMMPMFMKDKDKYVAMMAKAFVVYQDIRNKKALQNRK